MRYNKEKNLIHDANKGEVTCNHYDNLKDNNQANKDIDLNHQPCNEIHDKSNKKGFHNSFHIRNFKYKEKEKQVRNITHH